MKPTLSMPLLAQQDDASQRDLFAFAAVPEPERCAHPPHARVWTGNLFTGRTDEVCTECNGTVTEG